MPACWSIVSLCCLILLKFSVLHLAFVLAGSFIVFHITIVLNFAMLSITISIDPVKREVSSVKVRARSYKSQRKSKEPWSLHVCTNPLL